MKLSKQSIVSNFPAEKMNKRIRRWFMLGLSLGRLLELCEGATLVRALCQLVEEYEHFIAAKKDMVSKGGDSGSSLASSDAAAQGQLAPFLLLGAAHGSAHVAAVVAVAAQAAAAAAAQAAGHSTSAAASGSKDDSSSGSSSGAIKPTLHKVAKIGVVYDYFQSHATDIPDQLDYCEIVQSLCDVLSLIYAKFLHPGCAPPLVHEAILRVDRKLKQLVLSKITTDLVTEVVTPLLKQEMGALLNKAFYDEVKSAAPSLSGGLGPKQFYQLDEGNQMNLREDDEEEEEAR